MTVRKVLAVSIVAMFCLSGYLMVISDESSASVAYTTHIEIYDDGSRISIWDHTKVPGSSAGVIEYREALYNTLGIENVDIVGHTILGISYKDRDYYVYTEDNIYHAFVQYYREGSQWVQMVTEKDFEKSSYVAVVYSQLYTQSQYDQLPEDQKDHYQRISLSGSAEFYAHKITEDHPKIIKDLMIIGIVILIAIVLAILAIVYYVIRIRNSRA